MQPRDRPAAPTPGRRQRRVSPAALDPRHQQGVEGSSRRPYGDVHASRRRPPLGGPLGCRDQRGKAASQTGQLGGENRCTAAVHADDVSAVSPVTSAMANRIRRCSGCSGRGSPRWPTIDPAGLHHGGVLARAVHVHPARRAAASDHLHRGRPGRRAGRPGSPGPPRSAPASASMIRTPATWSTSPEWEAAASASRGPDSGRPASSMATA